MFQVLVSRLINPSGLTPHGFCLLWNPWLIWSDTFADAAIGLAYFAIPLALVRIVQARRDLAFKPLFWLFAAFILLCGAGHWIEVLTVWMPVYGLEAILKVTTALVSAATAVALLQLIPHALALPSHDQMRVADEAMRESERRHRAGFLRSPMPLHILDTNGTITGVSDRWLDLLGYAQNEVIGRPIADFLESGSQTYAADWEQLLVQGTLRDMERRLVRCDGEVLDVLVSAQVERAPGESAARILGALVDVTARKRAEAALRDSEERLRQTQKLEALGQLAGGIAHDFNNVLQAVSGGISLVERRAEDPAMVRRLARMVTEAAARGSATTRRLLAFARRNELQAAPLAVSALLNNFREILAHTLGAGVSVHVEAPDTLPPLLADRGELETVLANLATNARDAMPDGGTLTLSATAETVTADQEHPACLAPGDYIRITAADTGIGMDAATLAHATEPFFTTKPVNKGTGLGLAMTRGFAQQSGGGLMIASTPGRGTAVTLWLPQASEPVLGAAQRRADADQPCSVRAAGTLPRILLVDDEPLVRSVLAAEMEEQGYEVVQAESGAAALVHLGTDDAVALLVTDLSMPGMDGAKLIREAQRQRPRLRTILLTGYAGDTTLLATNGALSGSFTLLRKPISGAELADRAAALLEGCRAAG